MKSKRLWFLAGVAAGALGYAALARHNRILREEGLVWQRKRRPSLDVLGCPECHGTLQITPVKGGEVYHCAACKKDYPVIDGIAHFIQSGELTGENKQFAGMYDVISWGYRLFSKVAFAYIGMKEEQARREVTDHLEPRGGRVLEVSIGPGVNLPYLVHRSDVGEIYGLDISLGQLMRCRSFVAHQGWNTQLQLGNGEMLPYLDNTFDGVFHIGGINFFNDKKKAIEEMIRVARPGAHILICDETEKGARAYERFIPGFKKSTGQREPIEVPVTLVPPEMKDIRVFDVWKGWMYCIEFVKPDGKGAR